MKKVRYIIHCVFLRKKEHESYWFWLITTVIDEVHWYPEIGIGRMTGEVWFAYMTQ